MKFHPIAILCVALSSATMANPAQDTFFKKAENERKYQAALTEGKISTSRDKLVKVCQSVKQNKQPDLDCKCYSEQVAKLSDRDIFYESVVAFEDYMKTVAKIKQALSKDDTAEIERLKKAQSEKDTLTKRLSQACG
ncbi:hypothetical protein [Motilimonas pumila]|uniref:Uncharacterized protein n=1 Tax=Motilimonas pumila TaxID=2303987 RepID=A0A418YGA9_9GAMM|nr:hypothetical protein [Motilimonas pumila]RJG48686.1 hypothetical protein D1Z90_07445 [Motilimonas pumila]